MQKDNRKSIYGKLFFISWATFCITLFIFFSGRVSVLHSSDLLDWKSIIPKLARIEPLNYFTNILGAFFGVVLFSLACVSLGAVFTSLLWGEKKSNISTKPSRPILLATAFLIGSGIFSTVFLILSEIYKLTPAVVITTTLVGFVLGIRSLIRLFKGHSEDHNFNIFESPKNSGGIIFWLSVSILLLSLMYSSSRLSYDSVALYFSDAKITAMTGHVQSFSNDSFIVSSFHTGIQYTILMQVFGDQAARIYSWVNGLIMIIFTLALGEQFGLSKSARRILLALLLTTTAFTDLLGDGKIDLATSAPAIAAIYWMVANGVKARNRNFFLVGFLAGFAIISRPFNAFLLGIFFALFYLEQIYSQRKTEGFRLGSLFTRLLWLILAIIGLSIFHLAANWMILGDPLAPFTNASKLNSGVWQWAFDPDKLWILRVLYPFTVTYLNSPQSLGTITPLFISFLPGIFIKEIKEHLFSQKSLITLTAIAIITLLLWITLFFTVVEIRYVFFLWIILFIPLAVIAEKVLSLNDVTAKSLELIVIVILLFVNVRVIYISLDTYSPIDGQGNPHCYDHVFCDYLSPINNKAAQGERVLTLNAYRYYLRSDLFACSTKADEYRAIRDASLQSPAIFWEEVYRQGYTFVAYEKNYSVRHLYMNFIPSPNNVPSWMELEPIYGNLEYPVVAYKINVHEAPISSTKICVQNENKVWEVQSANSKP